MTNLILIENCLIQIHHRADATNAIIGRDKSKLDHHGEYR